MFYISMCYITDIEHFCFDSTRLAGAVFICTYQSVCENVLSISKFILAIDFKVINSTDMIIIISLTLHSHEV